MAIAAAQRDALQRQVTVLNLSTIGAALLLAVALLIGIEYWHLRNAFLEDMRVQARLVSDNSTAALVFSDLKAANETLSALRASPSVARAQLFNLGGTPVAEYRRDTAATPVQSAIMAGETHVFHARFLELYQPVVFENKKAGTLYICVSLSQLYSRLTIYSVIALLSVLGALAAAALLLKGMRKNLVKAEDDLNFLALYDPVTNLPNRNAMNQRIVQAIARADRIQVGLAVLFLDLDNFKIINDTLGHDVGDQLLKEVALRLTTTMRTSDSVFRLGGDEFTVLIEDIGNTDSVVVVAKNILNGFQKPFRVLGHEVYVSTSIGISCMPEDAYDFNSLLKNADTAMYHAKEHGKNNYQFFLAEMNNKAVKRLDIETNLRRAVENKEFEVYYQPQVDQYTREVVGMEALIRWNHPERGMIPPNDFISIAEDCGLILPIGDWILRAACAQCQSWHNAGYNNLKVAVNLSSKQFRQENLPAQIAQILAETGLAPAYLDLEITESAIMETSDRNIGLLKDLRAMGLSLSIDDFGTGYSSMTYLKRFPISKLKIDRSFVRDIPGDAEDCAIAEAVIVLANALSMEVVAEGVETREQADFLLQHGCHLVQGYFYSRPLPVAAATAFLSAGVAKRGTPLIALAN